MKHATKLTNTQANTPEAWKPLAKVAALVVTLLLYTANSNALTILNLTGDVGQTTPDLFFPTATALAGTTNDTFGGIGYNPLSPTSPLPVRSYTGASPVGYHGPNQPSVTVAYAFDGVYNGFFFDLYGRSDGGGAEFRDNGLVLNLYNGDWITPVFTSAPFDIPDSAPWFYRFDTPPGGISADRVSITGPAFFTLMEIRAVVPEPSMALLAIVGGAFLLRRRK